MTIELKPCPLCGCAAGFVKHSAGMPGTQGYDKWDAVACKHCRATVGACDRRFRRPEDAAAVWNLRVAAAPSALLDEREALQAALKALEAIADDMTVGDRWTNAGQHLLDALGPVRAALAAPAPAVAAEPASPMSKMAAVLREKARNEREAFDARVQSGEWGPMPDAWTEADHTPEHVATVEGYDAVREMRWNPRVAAFDFAVGTKLYAQAAPAVAAEPISSRESSWPEHPHWPFPTPKPTR